MLEILASGFPIDLPADISVDLIIENPFMLQDRIPTSISTTFALPPTPRNLALSNFPNRIAAVESYDDIEGIEIRFKGSLISSGKLKFDSYLDKKINQFFIGATYVPNPETMMFSIDMEQYTMDYCATVSEVVTQTGFYTSYKNLLASTLDGSQKFVCPPVRVINEKQFAPFDIPGGDGTNPYYDFLRLGLSENRKFFAQAGYINFWNVFLNAWRYVDEHMTNVAFPFVGYIFDVAFNNKLSNNLFNSGELAKLVMINLHHPEFTGFWASSFRMGCVFDNGLGDNTPYFKLNTACPEFQIGTFLKDVLKIFCISIFAKSDGTYEMAFNKDICNDNDSEDWTPYLVGEPGKQLRTGQSYAFGYNNVLEEIQEDTGIEKSYHKDMYDIPYASLPVQCKITSTGEIYKVSMLEITEGAKLLPYQNSPTNLIAGRYYMAVDDYIVWNGNDHKPVGTIIQAFAGQLSFGGNGRLVDVSPDLYQFECVNQGLGGVPDGDYQMISEVTPLPMILDIYWCDDQEPRFGPWLVPVFTEPRYVRPKSAHIGFYHGMQKCVNNTDQYPYVSSHNLDTQGTRIGNISLSMNGDDGVFNIYHQEFKDWINKNKKAIPAVMQLDEIALKNLNFKKKKNILGVNFYVEKILASLKMYTIDLAEVDLLEA